MPWHHDSIRLDRRPVIWQDTSLCAPRTDNEYRVKFVNMSWVGHIVEEKGISLIYHSNNHHDFSPNLARQTPTPLTRENPHDPKAHVK